MTTLILLLTLVFASLAHSDDFTVGTPVSIVKQILSVPLTPRNCNSNGDCSITITIPVDGKIVRSGNSGGTYEHYSTGIYADLKKMKSRETPAGIKVLEIPVIVEIYGGLGIFMASSQIEVDMKQKLNTILRLDYVGPEIPLKK